MAEGGGEFGSFLSVIGEIEAFAIDRDVIVIILCSGDNHETLTIFSKV